MVCFVMASVVSVVDNETLLHEMLFENWMASRVADLHLKEGSDNRVLGSVFAFPLKESFEACRNWNSLVLRTERQDRLRSECPD